MTALDGQIARDGYAEILVVLKPEKRVRGQGIDLAGTRDLQEEVVKELAPYFGRFEKSREVLIARELRHNMASANGAANVAGDAPKARAFRYFPNLGLMIGTVDARGLSALEKSTKGVSSVTPWRMLI